MRPLLSAALFAFASLAYAQSDELAYRFNYAFIEDGPALAPLKGDYSVEYLGRGQWWFYTPPRLPVNYAGQRKALKALFAIGGRPLMLVEMPRDYEHPDQKLRVVRGLDTMIVDIQTYGQQEDRMRKRTAVLGQRPRPPVLLPFRKGWFTEEELAADRATLANTERFDALWQEHRKEVLALLDTTRYSFSLMMDDHRTEPTSIVIQRDANYAHHLLEFPASGPGAHFELYLQDSTGKASDTVTFRADMPADGETTKWVDITALPYGKYTAYLKWEGNESLFYFTHTW
mgnify:CR=1 FL=1